jgi:hypothetical protein
VNSENICKKAQKATANFTVHNGKVQDTRVTILNDCGGAKKGKPKKSSR